MRILFLTFYYPPDVCACAFRAHPLVQSLQKHGPEDLHIEVLTTMPHRYSSFDAEARPLEEEKGLVVRRFAIPEHQGGMVDQSRSFLSYRRQVLRAVRGQQWDLILATSSRLMTAALGAQVARRHGAPLYLDIRDLLTDILDDLLGSVVAGVAGPILKVVEKRAFTAADRINLVSAGFDDHMEEIVGHSSFGHFTNGIDDTFLTWSPRPRKSGDHPLTVLYAGNIGEGQGLHRVVPQAALALAGEAQFRIIGDGGRRGALEEEVKRLGVENVQILDPMPRSELLAHYESCDALLLHLNDYQAFRKVLPSKVFEYGASGRPILAGVAGFAAQFVRSELPDSFVFQPCDSAALVEGVRALRGGAAAPDRSEFRQRFARTRIMDELAQDILRTAEGTNA